MMTSIATAAAVPSKEWNALTAHLNRWYYNPDLEALECVLSAVAAHYAIQSDPVWLFVQGPSSSGKTSIVINCVSETGRAHVLGDLTRHTFISFYKGEVGGLLPQIKESGILLFKDFTTILSKRDDERTEIISQLREIYDGSWRRDTGSNGYTWEGKITVIAACTPAIERAWALKRDLGERFLTVKWGRSGSTELARAAGRQRGHENNIKREIIRLGKAVLCAANLTEGLPYIPDRYVNRISALSEIVACMRAPVIRDTSGKREIVDIPAIEEPGRIHKALCALMSAHAALFKREPSDDDFRIARRVALDSIPTRRSSILNCFKSSAPLLPAMIAKMTHTPTATVAWHAAEMSALGAFAELGELDQGITEYQLRPEFQELLEAAGIMSNLTR